jgi:hypothetical protein
MIIAPSKMRTELELKPIICYSSSEPKPHVMVEATATKPKAAATVTGLTLASPIHKGWCEIKRTKICADS